MVGVVGIRRRRTTAGVLLMAAVFMARAEDDRIESFPADTGRTHSPDPEHVVAEPV